uniref:STAT transcription factor all-alpha domain-containing protein n=1 Tax=Poecilia mexicana TaxID=48701 RepID=A0A3B3Y8H9_9TELE
METCNIGAANWMFLQGALEQSLQNSVAFERQKNMDNRVSIIRNSVQVLMDQAVKNIEDMQDDFDFCYKTLQSRGERRFQGLDSWKETLNIHVFDFPESADRTSEMIKQGITRLQEMLNRLDFKRKLRPELQDWKRRQQIAAIGGPLLTAAATLFQIKRQLDKLGELVVKVTYESDPIPLQKPQMEERVKYLIYHLIKR